MSSLLRSGRKPISNKRSASSMTRIPTSFRLRSPVVPRSNRRPGVPTMMSSPRRKRLICPWRPTPPKRLPMEKRICWFNSSASCSIWTASSRVGTMINPFFLTGGGISEHALEDRDQKCSGFSGPGLGLNSHIRILQRMDQGLFLNGRQLFISSAPRFHAGAEVLDLVL